MNQMMKAYLVDDEYLERTLLRYSIPWKDYGVEIAGEAGSGRELLAMLQKEQPDILFTDICMPCMDGLTLSHAIRERYRDIDIVLLSGHREFDYAKKAIYIGVTDYLLKPVNREEVAMTLEKIRKRRSAKDGASSAMPDLRSVQSAEVESGSAGTVKRATRFIADSLSDSSLSLKTVAEHLFVNPSYLSRIFRQETGKTLTDYIMHLRIVQSTEYFRNTDLREYEVAEKTGFNDCHYFSLCFKKCMGRTVQEYRRECLSCRD